MSKSWDDVIYVTGWSLHKVYQNWYEPTGPYEYVVASCFVHNHPRFGTTYNYYSTQVVGIDEDELGVYAIVASGKRIYLKDHYHDLTSPA